ncbi:MAG: aldo/keto reductase [Fuerstiella sp.]|jgi:aryl-alcohol dehydrogenase-like predicted oxidoreductase|nr:aldo/keto reductase [Fuerstiella sp.]
MQFRTLGNSGLKVSVIGLGTWAIGGGDWKFGWGDQDESEAIDTIVKSVDVGINWIDTAAIYGLGRSEQLVGKALKLIPQASRPIVATKCGRTDIGHGDIGKCLRRDSIVAECEASLQRLDVECIDLYQLHWPEPEEQIEEGWQTLVDLKQQGKVRHIGVSNHSVEQMSRLQAIHPITSLQPPYSMIARGIEPGILPFCGQEDIGVVCYSPMGKGMLTGTFTAERVASLPEKDHRTRDARFQSPQLEINLAFVDELATIASGLGWTLPELSIAWVLRCPELTSAIVGARRPDQITQTAIAGTRNLNGDSATAVESALSRRADALAALGDIEQPKV